MRQVSFKRNSNGWEGLCIASLGPRCRLQCQQSTCDTEDDQEKSKVIEESDSTIPDPSHQTVTSTPPVIAPFTDVSSTKPSLLVTPPPINTEATTITTSDVSAKSGKIGARDV
ncbi:hypothetical protein Tco_0048987 [Tanacetum coccineum]